ncbi:hypothetical protein FKW77_004514 [Venturia effusa]|uniref:tripeptidyl-peptidase II n=1 Tax=Venturia effusa TaxID=50376 RepID=A0A517LH22_9PEZI|nr:hypothetical protein FKW77_004514 [Venturia effusa]
MVSKTILGAIALSLAAGSNAAKAMRQMESVSKAMLASRGWTVAKTPAAQESITLQIALAFQNTDKIISTLLDLSNPKSPNYGKWLDRDEVNAIVQPSQQANEAVIKWLKSEGVSKVASDGTTVTFQTTIDTANRVLKADFQGYEKSGIVKIRTTDYSVPEDLAEHVDLIHPTTFFGKTKAFAPLHAKFSLPPKKLAAASLEKSGLASSTDGPAPQKVPEDCAVYTTPECMKLMYNIGNYTALASSGSRVGFGSFLSESADPEDLRLFLNYFGIPQQNHTKVEITKGAADLPDRGVGESDADVQIMIGIANPLPVTEFLTGGRAPFIPDIEMPDESKNSNEPYLPYYEYLSSKTNAELPQAISNSYGEPEQTVPRAYAERVCTMIALMGTRGITVLESSGDIGVGAECLTNGGNKTLRFEQNFPSSCPWITSVGGTESVNPEIAWTESSGGFSDYFPRPDYQAKAVETYFTEKAPPAVTSTLSPYYNKSGRGFPDIAAHSIRPNFVVFALGDAIQFGGTSGSVPAMAGIIGLLNDARLRAGLPTMGFINPWLYASGSDFLADVTTGASRGCDGTNHQNGLKLTGSGLIPGAYWNATVGWDPSTGLGLPDFQLMLKSALASGKSG